MTTERSKEQGHTPEPWRIDYLQMDHEHDDPGISANGYWVATLHRNIGAINDPREANARRIVACVNACAGIEDPAKYLTIAHSLTQRHDLQEFDEIEAERDALKALNAELVKALEEIDGTLSGSLPITSQVKAMIRAALAKAKS